MRSYQVFASISPERGLALMRSLSEKSPAMFRQAVDAAAVATRTRPVYLRRQPMEKRAEAVRRALSRVSANVVADELLAVYFLECRKPLLLEWLDTIGVEHEDGMLQDYAPVQPAKKKVHEAAKSFCAKEDDPDRDLLLRAFAAQEAIDWPDLDAVFEAEGAAQSAR